MKTRLALVLAVSLFSINWTIRDLGTLPGGSSSFATAINNYGEIVGGATNAAGAARAVVFQPTSVFEIPTATGFGGSVATDISDKRMVVGQSPTGGFRYPLGGSVGSLGANTGAYAVNAFNDIGGYQWTSSSTQKALIWWGGGTAPPFYIGVLGSGNSSATLDVADGKAAAGWSRYSKGSPYHHAFLWIDGTMFDLGTLGGAHSGADALVVLHWPESWPYSATHVVGFSEISSLDIHAFHWTAGTMTDLGTLPGDYESRALDINRNKIAVGYSKKASGTRAVMWQTWGPTIIDLNTLLPPGSGWVLTMAHGINNLGQIVGSGLHGGVPRGFVLTP